MGVAHEITPLLTLKETAAILRVSTDTVRRLVREEHLRAVKVGPSENSPYRIPSGEVDRWIARSWSETV